MDSIPNPDDSNQVQSQSLTVDGSNSLSNQTDTTVNVEDVGVNIDPKHQEILQAQIHIQQTPITYAQLYTFATSNDWFLMVIGFFFAGAAGAALVIFHHDLFFRYFHLDHTANILQLFSLALQLFSGK